MNKNTRRKPGRPPLPGEKVKISFRLRRNRSPAEDALLDRLEQLPPRQQSRFLRRVLTTGEIDTVLDRELARETEKVASALDAMATLWDDEDDDETDDNLNEEYLNDPD